MRFLCRDETSDIDARSFKRRVRRVPLIGVGCAALLVILLGPWAPGSGRSQPAPDKAATIIGSWKTTCENAQGMVLQVVDRGSGAAVGRVEVVGLASEFGYKQGDEIIQITAGSGGAWTGKMLWRNTAGVQRWQPITVRLSDGRFHGVTEGDYCYENMERVR